jgi:hypothetical protein
LRCYAQHKQPSTLPTAPESAYRRQAPFQDLATEAITMGPFGQLLPEVRLEILLHLDSRADLSEPAMPQPHSFASA